MKSIFHSASIALTILTTPLAPGAPVIVTSPGPVAPAFGTAITLAASVTTAAPTTYVWTRDGTPIINGGRYSGASTTALSITGVNNTDNGSYTLTATDTLGSAATTPASVTVTQLETTRDSATSSLSSNSTVGAILHLPDGRTLIGGNLNGAGSTTAYTRLAIVGTDYRVTPTPLGLFNGTPSGLVRQPDGKILVLGASTEIGGVSGVGRTYFSRLNTDLTLDTSFLPPVPNNTTTAAVVDAQGRIYLGGNFTNLGGGNDGRYSYLVRLLPDGRLDSSFSILLNGNVTDLVMQADGKIIVGGTFQAYGPTETFTLVQSLIRLNADGSYDSGFTANYAPSEAYGTGIKDLALDSQQRLLIASFHLGSTATPYGIYRLLPSGAKDPTFAFSETLSNYALAIQPVSDDKLLVAGNFTTPVRKFFRLDNAGTRDAAFTAGLGTGFAADSHYIQTIAPDALGRTWLGGDFESFKSTTVNRLLVLQGQAPALAFSAQPLARFIDIGGTATFTAAATGNNGFTFQWRKNGTPLADGGRISGATTATLAITGLIATDSADYTVIATSPSGASTFTSITSTAAPLAVLAAPEILTPPSAITRDLGGSATFAAAARGAGTLTYQWLLGTTPLSNGTVGGVTIAGATTPTLTISGITFTQAGGYSLRVTNTLSQTTSAAALLTIQRRPEALAAGLAQPSFNGDVQVIRPLADGTTLVGGAFTSVTINGVTTTRNRLVHLLSDGTLDSNFAPSFNNSVSAIEVDSAGRIFIGGDFTSVTFGATTTSRTRIARLTAALSLDPAFDTATAGPNSTVRALAPTGDGSVYVGGLFTQVGAVATSAVSRLVLLNAAGAIDSSFTSYATGDILSLVRLPDGTLYAASLGATWNSPGVTGSPSGSLIKLSATGARDTAFAPPALVLNFFAPSIQRIQLLADGSLLAAGYGTSPQAYLRRFHATTGAELTNYSVGHAATVFAIAQQADGKILSGSNPLLSRIALNGTADAGFNIGSGLNNTIRTLAVDGSNRIWIGGAFTSYNGVPASRLAIINGGDFESQSGPLTPQVITFPPLADRNTLDAPFALAATSDSGLPVSYSISGPATLSGSTVTLAGATGTVTITATQAGNATTAAATPVIRSFAVIAADPLADFLTNAGVPANLRGANDDADNDGLDNLLEYALDLNPNGSGGAFTGTLPTTVLNTHSTQLHLPPRPQRCHLRRGNLAHPHRRHLDQRRRQPRHSCWKWHHHRQHSDHARQQVPAPFRRTLTSPFKSMPSGEPRAGTPSLIKTRFLCVTAAMKRISSLYLLAFASLSFGGETIALFNGKDLSGWKADVPSADSNPSLPPVFIVRDGKLVSLGKPGGHLITTDQFSNYKLVVEYRFAKEGGNCGVLVNASTLRRLNDMFPQSIEVQMMHENAGDFWCIGENIEVPDMETRRPKKEPSQVFGGNKGDARRIVNLTDGSEKPLGEWNTMEIEVKGDEVIVHVNGTLVNHGRKSTATSGAIALQSEGVEVEFRKVELTKLE